jgi:hypothetical protein
MHSIRRILLTEYMGAILIALLVSDAFIALFGAIAQQFAYHSYLHRYKPWTAVLVAEQWNSLLTCGAKIVLYLISAYLLARWLYGPAGGKENDAVAEHARIENEPAASEL